MNQTCPNQNAHTVQTDHMLNETFPLDSSNSFTSTDVLHEAVVSTDQTNSNKKRKTHKKHISNNCSSPKQRKKISCKINKTL